MRRDIGQPVRPQDQPDEDLKLMAMQALQNSAPEQAIPMLEKVLARHELAAAQRASAVRARAERFAARARDSAESSPRADRRRSSRARPSSTLACTAVRESRAVLAEIYASSTDVDVKRRILRAFMVAGEKDRLWKAAQGEQNADLRAEAVRQLGVMGAHEELWQLYQKESSVDVKKQVIRAMFVGGNADRMIDLAKTEKNPDLRREAIRSLGLMGSKQTGDALVEIYGTPTGSRHPQGSHQRAVPAGQRHGARSGSHARRPDMTLKREIVQKLSLMDSKVATDFMIELLGK